MSRTFYTALSRLALPLIFLRLWWRGRKNPAYRKRWGERLAWYRAPKRDPSIPAVLFHAVSVGEVHAAQPLIDSLRRARPQLDIIVTCTTPTGSARIQQLFAAQVRHVYLPYDLPGAVERFLDYFSPDVLVLLETELWPNLLRACRQHDCTVILANARLSERSFNNYRKHAELARQMLETLDQVVAQSAADGERFVQLGLPEARLQINGSLKFDVAIDTGKVQAAQAIKAAWHQRPVWIAASTREGEDRKVLRATELALKQIPDLLTVLVPRHPERFAEADAMASAMGISTVRFSSGQPVTPDVQLLVGDTMGDMPFYYALAEVAFVGGSLVDTGCQNIIEPAALGLPVLTGPSLYNFQAVGEMLCKGGGMKVVADEAELAEALLMLVRDPQTARETGERARAVVAANKGATQRLCKLIEASLFQ